MGDTVDRSGVSRLRITTVIPALAIALLAVGTIIAAMWLRASGIEMGEPMLFSVSEVDLRLADYIHTLFFLATIGASLVYMVTTSDKQSPYYLAGALVVLLLLGVSLGSVRALLETPLHIGLVVGGALALAGAHYTALHTRFDWLSINVTGLLLVPPVLVIYSHLSLRVLVGVLIVTAIYDFVAVHRSDLMEQMAEGIIPLRVPVVYMVPQYGGSLQSALEADDLHQLRILGMGDVAVPGIFVVAVTATFPGMLPLPALTALLGYVGAYFIIVADPFDKAMYAGLPFLNAGVLLGCAVALPFM